MNDEVQPYHVRFLRDELARRKRKNRRYSMRAFANFLKMDPAALSRIMAGKQEISVGACVTALERLLDSKAEDQQQSPGELLATAS